eukprot:90166_1
MNQQSLFNYYQPEPVNQTKVTTEILTPILNQNYRNNNESRDNREVPLLVKNFVQWNKENKCNNVIKQKPWIDVCPFKCDRDNLNYMLWPAKRLIYCNSPFSGWNVPIWMKELLKFVIIKKGTAIMICKAASICAIFFRIISKYKSRYNNVYIKK